MVFYKGYLPEKVKPLHPKVHSYFQQILRGKKKKKKRLQSPLNTQSMVFLNIQIQIIYTLVVL